MANTSYIRWFEQVSLGDIPLVGGKNASLGELYQHLTPLGVRVPNGFAVTARAYRDLLDQGDLESRLKALLATLDPALEKALASVAEQARELIYRAELPPRLEDRILEAYGQLRQQYPGDLRLAVRSSATAEDLPSASFAGQHESFLNISDESSLMEAYRRCLASLFTERAISYRIHNGFDHCRVYQSVTVMKMVRADLGASGVMFTLDTESGFRDVVLINGGYGLGENVVQGAIDPDEFYVHKPSFRDGFRCVLRRTLGSKKLTMVCGEGGRAVENTDTPAGKRERYCLEDEEVLELADYGMKIESHYCSQKGGERQGGERKGGEKTGRESPMDIEWARDGEDGKLYIVQARPETVASQKSFERLIRYELTGRTRILARGKAIGDKVATGHVHWVRDKAELPRFKAGEILLADSTSPDWGPALGRAAAIVTLRGGRTCHAAIVAREFGIPAVIGIGPAGESLADGAEVTVSCAEGDQGRIYEGTVPYRTTHVDIKQLPRPKTRMMINLGNPESAFSLSALPCDGIGLARMEFIITESIAAHPMALLHPEKVCDRDHLEKIKALTANYDNGAQFFIERLSEGIGTIAAAFYPRPVIVRLSDFKSNEYAGLLGGKAFEPGEENPMLGLRGAARYTHPDYQEAFALECAAALRARKRMGLHNLMLMIPFCRRVDEGRRVIEAMANHGLKRGHDGLQLYVMCEIPNNVVQIDAFSNLFDGISIGSNDLTQLVLGVDRDSERVAFDFDERDPGVMEMIRQAVVGAHRNGITAGICGQAPSDYPEYAEFLVGLHIDSISLNPDALVPTLQHVAKIEAGGG